MSKIDERELCWKQINKYDNCDLWEDHDGGCLATCGDCKEGRCHIPLRPPVSGVGDPTCGCARHADSIEAWRRDQGPEQPNALEVDPHEICMTDPGSERDLCAVTDDVLEAAWRNAVEQKAAGEADREETLPVLRAALAGVQHHLGRQLVPTGPWHAVVRDRSGFIADDPVQAILEEFADGGAGEALICICKDTALNGREEGRMAGTYISSDIFLEIDLYDLDEDDLEEGLEAWRRAQAAADGLNRMAAESSTPETSGATR